MQRAGDLDSLRSALAVYARIWAFAVLFSQLSSFHWAAQIPAINGMLEFLALTTAAWVAFFRFSPRGWLLAIVSETVNLALRLPEIPNHCHVILFINFLILSAFLRSRGNHEKLVETFWSTTISFLQATTLCVYFFAFFAKLNWTYIDPDYSCSIKFFRNINAFVGFLPINRFTSLMVIHGSLVLEGLLPLLLWRRSTRMFGVALGLLFHYGLAFDLIKYFTNFSGVMFALLLTFCPPSFFRFLYRYWLPGSASAGPQRSPLLSLPGALGFLGLIAIVATGAYAVFAPADIGARVWRLCELLRHLGWTTYSSLVLLAFGRFWWTGTSAVVDEAAAYARESNIRGKRSYRWLEIGILTLVVVNGASPYLGFKTRTSFNMYSNLRIEPETSNHFVFTASLNLLGFLSHPARIEPPIETGAELMTGRHAAVCQSGMYFGSWYPLAEIARRVRECPEQRFVFFYDRRYYEAHSIEAQALLDAHSSWWSRRFSIFRPMDERAAVDCIW